MDHRERGHRECHTPATLERERLGVDQQTSCTYVNKLKCFYTNTDTLLNKRTELSVLIHEQNPDIIGITEILAKKRAMDPEDLEFHIEGYAHVTNLEEHHKRGVILYTKSHLNATIKKITGADNFEESIWCEVSLKGSDSVLIGVVYRSPSCNNVNHEHLRTLLRNAADIGTSHVLIMGDFNYGDINWANGTTPSQLTNPVTAFAETLGDLYYHQHITDPTVGPTSTRTHST